MAEILHQFKGSLPIIYDGFYASHVVVWDFWTINSSLAV